MKAFSSFTSFIEKREKGRKKLWEEDVAKRRFLGKQKARTFRTIYQAQNFRRLPRAYSKTIAFSAYDKFHKLHSKISQSRDAIVGNKNVNVHFTDYWAAFRSLGTFHSIVVAPKESPSTFRKIYRSNRGELGEGESEKNNKNFRLYVAPAVGGLMLYENEKLWTF